MSAARYLINPITALAALGALLGGIAFLLEAELLFDRWAGIPLGLFVWVLGLGLLWLVLGGSPRAPGTPVSGRRSPAGASGA